MNKNQLRIAFISNQISWGGAPKSLLLLIKSLNNQNFKLYLYSTRCVSQEMKTEFEQYVEFVKLIKLPEIKSAQTENIKENIQKVDINRFSFSTVELLAKELNDLNIDILHLNNSVFSPIYKTIKDQTRVKIITHVREWIDWNGIHNKQKFMYNTIMNDSDAIICISNTEAQLFKQHTNLYVIPNPFDFHELESCEWNIDQVKSKLTINKNHFIVGMIGRTRNKGTLDFLKALVYLRSNFDDATNIKFVILGEEIPPSYNKILYFLRKLLGKSTYLQDIYKFINNENLSNEVQFLNNRKDVLEIINCFDIAVRPSYSGDPWGRDIIEFMALKKPVVATGTSDFFIKNGETGFLVAPRDYKKLAEKIYWLFKNKKEKNKIGERAFELIYAKCNMNEFKQKILQVYENL